MIAISKALVGTVSAVVPVTAVATTTHFLKNNSREGRGQSSTKAESPKNCYSITVSSISRKESFLVCNNSEFYFYSKGQTNPYKKVKSLKIQDTNNIVIVFGESSETKTLTGNEEEWKDLTKDEEFFNQQERSCVVSSADGSWSGKSGDKVLSCTETSPYKVFKPIKLKTFTE